jgi:glycosyltransferase involved in cell wall biosynthesis
VPLDESGLSLIITHVVAPAPFGGLEQVVYALATGQAAHGHDVKVIALIGREPGPLVERLETARIRVQCLSFGRHYLRERRELSRLLRAGGPAVVHTHGYRPDVQGGAAAGRVEVPAVSTVHGFTGGDAKNLLYERLQRRALRRFAAVVAVSRPLVDRLVASGVARDRIHLVPNAYHASGEAIPRVRARGELGLSADRGDFVIGWVGRVSREKGPDLLIEALGLLSDSSVRVAIIGDGPDRNALEARAAALGLSNRIRWLGIVPEAARRFAAFDCLVLSSRTEGTPIVLLEAMAAGIPIVATAVGGVPDVVSSDEALLVTPGDSAALARAIHLVRSDSAGAAVRAAQAANRLRAERGLGPWLAAYEAVYRQVAFPQPRSAA